MNAYNLLRHIRENYNFASANQIFQTKDLKKSQYKRIVLERILSNYEGEDLKYIQKKIYVK